jgi:hypothetical protein
MFLMKSAFNVPLKLQWALCRRLEYFLFLVFVLELVRDRY